MDHSATDVTLKPTAAASPTSYFASTPGAPPGVPGGGMTGMELGSGTGAVFIMPGSTPGFGLITPPLESNFSLRLSLRPDANGAACSFSGITLSLPGAPGED